MFDSYRRLFRFLFLSLILVVSSCDDGIPTDWQWETIETKGQPTARHEAGLVAYKDNLYLLGGRRINPTSVYDTQTSTWTEKSETPIELHHFQPVVYGDAIYIIGAMTGQWPNETPVDKVIIYYPEKDEFVYSHNIPEHRRRGGAGAVVYKDKIYLVGGITNGHMDGFRPWLDVYDPKTGNWETLADAPHARDHFQAVVSNDKIYAFAGRRSSRSTEQDMDLTVSYGNVYDIKSGQWQDLQANLSIPTERAGNMAFVWNNDIIIGGGESMAQKEAHSEVEAFDPEKGVWRAWPSLQNGRHGTGFAIVGDYVYTASGCGNRGGEPELSSLERLQLPKGKPQPISESADTTKVVMQWHQLKLDFEGPETSEDAEDNPFLNYRLEVEFTHNKTSKTLRGYYAADGNAAESSATSGNIWSVNHRPDLLGKWTYKARLLHGDSIAIKTNSSNAEDLPLKNSTGTFMVSPSDKAVPDFRAKGQLVAENGYFKFKNSDTHWLKAGANSPENLLGYVDFDDTYRIKSEAREGEAAAPEVIHSYDAHTTDWQTGNPTWKNGKGKNLIGAINYLASKGMNSAYFLTLNILGDGKDVWPYNHPDSITRFDTSKLAQWEIVFEHMQSKGILLHMVLQETENETLLDNGDTGSMRRLYFNELMARFGHHLGLVWNLGEENGPAPWTPVGQNDAQRKAMASYLKANDPYQHPVLLHTHSYDPLRADILSDILGFKDLDGLSLQQAKREETATIISEWRKKSEEAGKPWLITMDEIGEWHTAALPDAEDPNHDSLRHYALWGSLLSGAAGVEWYFGAQHPHNDLTSEDWRQRDRLWTLSKHATDFFNLYLPYWDMSPAHELINSKESYCLRKVNEVYAIYLPDGKSYTIDLSEANGKFSIKWYNPLEGGELMEGTTTTVSGGGKLSLGTPPGLKERKANQDWVVLVKRED